MYTRRIALFVLRNKEGKILLQHRTEDAPIKPGYWAFFGGGIDKGETPEQAVKREAFEELGITSFKNLRFFNRYVFYEEDLTGWTEKYFFTGDFNHDIATLKKFQQREGEGQNLALCRYEDLGALKIYKNDMKVLDDLLYRTVSIVGHRGASGYASENTLLSFQKAIDAGCHLIELDVRLSKDKHVIVFHDEMVDRMTNGSGLVRNLTLKDLKKLNCENNQMILTLDEVIGHCKDKIDLWIELKDAKTPKPVFDIINKHGMNYNVTIPSFDIQLLKEIKDLNPLLRVCFLFYEYSDQIWDYIKSVPLDYIGPKKEIVSKEMIEKAHNLGSRVFTYVINDRVLGGNLIGLGIDAIGTDYPQLFGEFLSS